MDNATLPALVLFAVLPFVSTVLGGLAALRLRHRLHPVMAFAAGVLVATALVNLLPEATELIGESGGPLLLGGAALGGFLDFSSLEALLHRQTWEHEHPPLQDPGVPHEHARETQRLTAIGLAGPAGMIAHDTLDGAAIGLAFSVTPELGLIVALAVVVHTFADGVSIVTVALTRGGGRFVLVLLALAALARPAGILLGTLVPLSQVALGALLAVFAGVFLAIGAGHLLPEAQHRQPASAPPLVLVAGAGAILVLAVRTVLEH